MTEPTDRTAEELRAAAEALRDAAKVATAGPWRVVKHMRRNHPSVLAQIELHKGETVRSVSTKTPGESADAEWTALVHPGLAEPLAEWLEAEAHMWTVRGNSPEGQTFHAMKVARAINGGGAGA